jgi:hypothetical protein
MRLSGMESGEPTPRVGRRCPSVCSIRSAMDRNPNCFAPEGIAGKRVHRFGADGILRWLHCDGIDTPLRPVERWRDRPPQLAVEIRDRLGSDATRF